MFSRKLVQAGVALLYLGLQFGCSSGPLELREHDLALQQWSGTAMLINYELNTGNQNIRNDGCMLDFQKHRHEPGVRRAPPG